MLPPPPPARAIHTRMKIWQFKANFGHRITPITASLETHIYYWRVIFSTKMTFFHSEILSAHWMIFRMDIWNEWVTTKCKFAYKEFGRKLRNGMFGIMLYICFSLDTHYFLGWVYSWSLDFRFYTGGCVLNYPVWEYIGFLFFL